MPRRHRRSAREHERGLGARFTQAKALGVARAPRPRRRGHSGAMPDVRRVENTTAFGALALADRVWARAAAIHRSGEWQASSLDLVTGWAPPDWRPEVWRYNEVVFVAEETDAAAVGA